MAAPFATLGDVPWLTLAEGTTVALSKGSFDGTLPLEAGIEVVGACAAETVLTGVDFPVPGVISVTSAGTPAVVRNLTVRGAGQSGADVERGRSLTLRGVFFDSVESPAIDATESGTEVVLEEVVIRDTQGAPPLAAFRGARDARLSGSRVLFVGNGVILGFGAEVVLEDATLDMQGQETALSVEHGSRADLSRALVTDSVDLGVFVEGAESHAALTDAVVRGTRPFPGEQGLHAVYVGAGSELELTRTLLANNTRMGLFVGGAGTLATVTDTVIAATQPSPDGLFGRGSEVKGGARMEANRLVLEGNHEVAFVIDQPETIVTLTDSLISGTQPRPGDGQGGWGLQIADGAFLDATRFVARDNAGVAMLVATAETRVVLTDTLIRETSGRGIQGSEGAAVTATRLEVDGADLTAILIGSDASIELSDVSVRDVRAQCSGPSCPATPYGYGVATISGTATLSSFRIEGAQTCGVLVDVLDLVSGAPGMDLERGTVSNSAIGACVQVPDYDIGRLSDRVVYRDNDVNLDTTSLPLPMLTPIAL